MIFRDNFVKTQNAWTLQAGLPVFNYKTREIIFPDFTFTYNTDCEKDQKTVHMELFHRWHSQQLLDRLEYLKNSDIENYIIGIENFLYSKQEVKDALSDSDWFENNGFTFRDFPLISKINSLLKARANSNK